MVSSRIDAHKQSSLDFLKLVVAGKIDEAYSNHVDMNGKHHNPFFAAGFPALQKGMKENHSQFPDKKMNVKNVLADGDVVAVHSEIVMSPGGDRMTIVHIHRYHENKIVELWDCGQVIPPDSPNKDGAF